jgi:hypothetical protein
VDRFDAYASQKLVKQIHGRVLRQAAHDRLGRRASAEHRPENSHPAWPSLIHGLSLRILIEATHLSRWKGGTHPIT